MIRVLFIHFILTFSFLFGLAGQTAEEIRIAAQQALEAYDTPGFAVGVIKDGQVVLSEGFGTRTINKDEKVDSNTLFAIASNTKAFIATAIVKLHQEGKLNLDDPVQKYLPYFQLYDEYVSQHTTIRDLLCHRVGLGTYSGDAIWYKTEKSAEEIIKQIKYLPQAYEWRGGYGYTNLMFITAGEVIREVTGVSWSEYINSNFLSPLGMTRTQTSVGELSQMSNVATPHVTHRENLPIEMAQWNTPGAAGGIISSTTDILKWLNVQLHPKVAGEKGVFPEATKNYTMKPHTPIGGLDFYSAGLGWFLYRKGGQAIVTHGGGYDGMYSRVILIPEMNIGIVVLTNSMTGLSSKLGNYIRDSYLGLPTDGWIEKAKEDEAKSRKSWQSKFEAPIANHVQDASSTIPSTMLEGTYHDPLYGDILISISEDDVLQLQFEDAPELSATLTSWHYDTYAIDWNEEHAWFDFGTVQFVLDNNRKVGGLKFDVPNDDIFFEEINPVKVD